MHVVFELWSEMSWIDDKIKRENCSVLLICVEGGGG